jgi:ATP-binding cassette, subfamily C, bacterial
MPHLEKIREKVRVTKTAGKMNNLKKILNLYTLFFRFAPARNTGIFLTNLFSGLSQGISIVTLIPLLQMLEKNSLGNNKVFSVLNKLMSHLGITISIELIIGLYLVLILFNTLISYAKSIWQSDVQQEYTAHIRKDIFSKLIRSDWLYLSGQNRNEFSQVLTSEIPSITALNFNLFSLLSVIIIFIIYVFLALFVSVYFTIFVLVCGLILYIPLNRFVTRTYAAGKDNFFTNRSLYKQFDDFWDTIKFAKVHGTEKYHFERFDEQNQQFAEERKKIVRLSMIPQTINTIASACILCVVIYIGYKFGNMSLSAFLILILLFSRIFPQLMRIHSTYMQVVSLFPSFENTMAMKHELETSMLPDAIFRNSTSAIIKVKKEIVLKDVSFGYVQDKPLFDQMNIAIPAMKITGIVGPSGIGKTTLMDLLTGLLTPGRGKMQVDDLDFAEIDKAAWHHSIAYVPQDSVFTNSSLRENLKMGNDLISDDQILHALNRVNAAQFVNELGDGLDTMMSNNAQQFSGGERQRLAIARALLREPSLLLLDEITNSLDARNEQHIISVLLELKKEITIVFITHKKELIRYFDNIIDVGNL